MLDAPFYKNEAAKSAAQYRTLAYYTKVGVPEMAEYYHHHLKAEAEMLGATDQNKSLKIKLLQKIKWLAPFPWLIFKK